MFDENRRTLLVRILVVVFLSSFSFFLESGYCNWRTKEQWHQKFRILPGTGWSMDRRPGWLHSPTLTVLPPPHNHSHNPLPLLYHEHHEPHDQTHKIPLSAHTLNNFLLCIHVVPVPLQTSKHDSHEPKPNPHTAATQPAHFLEFSLLTIKRSEGESRRSGVTL